MNASGIKFGLGTYTALFLVFLYGPLVVLAILSFQTGPEGGPQFPIIEWSTYWYKHLFALPRHRAFHHCRSTRRCFARWHWR